MARQVTQQKIKTLEPDTLLWDGEVPGFGVRVTKAGVKSFILSYRMNKRKHRYTIGRCAEWSADAARNKAIELRKDISNGIDPLEEKYKPTADEPTVGKLADEYLSGYVKKKRLAGQSNDRRMINGIVRPNLGTLQVKAVKKRDIEKLHMSLQATPYRANRVLSLLSKMFNLAVEWGWRSDNPVKGIGRHHEEPRKDSWIKKTEDLARLNKALDDYPDQQAANAIRLLLMTGSRMSEVLKAEWPQFELERGVWTKPSHHTKQKNTEHVPLSAPAIKLLSKMKPKGATGPLFPGKKTGSRVTLRRPWVQVCKAAGLADAETKKGKRRMITRYKPKHRIHDLRHTFASHLVSDGTSLQIVGKLLGHTNPQTTNRYAHVTDEALREATNRFGKIVANGKRKR